MKINAEKFLKISDQYQVGRLKEVAEKAMMKSLNRKNLLELMLAGYHYNGEQIKAAAMDFLAKNKEYYRIEWEEDLKGKEDLLLEILRTICGKGSYLKGF